MRIPARMAYKILSDNGVKYLYHANTVTTMCNFLRAGRLLSRGNVEQRGWPQTSQETDTIDKQYGLWFDAFADHVDIHERANRRNSYGPVLLEIDIKILRDGGLGMVSVTKKNPTKWLQNDKGADRWFMSAAELEQGFFYGSFDQMIVFRNAGPGVSFNNFLERVILDDPRKESRGMSLYAVAYGALTLAIVEGRLNVAIEKRECKSQCKCLKTYKVMTTKGLFLPDQGKAL